MPTEFEAVSKTMDLADELIKRVPSYLLKCDISKNAVDIVKNKLFK